MVSRDVAKRDAMNRTETAELLRTRRELSGGTYNDDTIDVWHEALAGWTYSEVRNALVRASRQHSRVTIASVVEHLRPLPANTPEGHARSCICQGRGFIEVEQRDDHHSWWAWARCPNGPPTGFIEIDA
jgi:hypothetical protein